ncbi:MAG: hypothetical protein APR54_07810 [Candidatus Cloacimonas sp. SDB]|nr:MAG: hypothetical protein APR54_07810 [Candidatus Cloacimonas sp. SDB]
MKKSYIIFIAMILLAGMLSANQRNMGASCQENPRMHEKAQMQHHDGRNNRFMLEELELTAEQMKAMQELKLEREKFLIRNKSEIEILQLDKASALQNKDFKEAKRITEAIFSKKQNSALKAIEFHEDRWNLLTVEQQEKASEKEFLKNHPPRKMPEEKGIKRNE